MTDTTAPTVPILDDETLEPADLEPVEYQGVRWLSLHLYHPGGFEPLVLEWVDPTVTELTREGWIDRAYFIRYGAGAPHVRLRLALARDASPAKAAAVAAAHAADFFARRPVDEALRALEEAGRPPQPARPELLREPALHQAPLELEVERYGGAAHYPASFRFFAVSSAHAVDVVRSLQGQPRGRMLPVFLDQLARQAHGFARDRDELLKLFHYFVGWNEVMAPILEKGDQVYEQQPEVFRGLVRRALDDDAPHPLRNGARELSDALGDAGPEVRWTVGSSQMHMTANRMGLLNAEESYVTQILWRAGRDLS